jgi:ketosteroid isomerase-like protein
MRKLLVLSLLLWIVMPLGAQTATENSRAEIDAFNRKFEDATRRMDTAATMELWAEDGISLLPSTKPIVGKAAIRAFFDGVMSQLNGARMERFEMNCSGIEIAGEMASEWCSEHQVVRMPNGKPPFDGRGRMLLVLRRGAEGKWRLLREMWVQAETE